jgi:hypothetical protein
MLRAGARDGLGGVPGLEGYITRHTRPEVAFHVRFLALFGPSRDLTDAAGSTTTVSVTRLGLNCGYHQIPKVVLYLLLGDSV